LPEEVFQLDLDVLLDALNKMKCSLPTSTSIPPTQTGILPFRLDQISVEFEKRVIAHAAGEMLESVELFDEYRGVNVPPGQRSFMFPLVYWAQNRTLTDEEVEPVHQKYENPAWKIQPQSQKLIKKGSRGNCIV